MFGQLADDDRDALRTQVQLAAARADVASAVRALHERVRQAVDARRPVCIASGRCCHFEAYGHRLFVTTLELAAFVHELDPAVTAVARDGGCPYQVGRLCGVHAARPFGCRMFYCDPTAADWQQEQYERFHAELRSLHASLGVDYFYVEWRQALAVMGLDGARVTVGGLP